ncbi:MAG: phenylalanine--tRNA ligase subunit beta [Patescibacteria group bacterium]|jgi:phenylalanyl-tRNA synthetase beta chain
MYISLNWLKDYVKIPSKIKPEDIATELTNHTVEVEGLVNSAAQFNNVVVGKVLEVSKHPNADRLRLTVVDVKKKKLNIVCGAPNVAAGQLVAVAMIGAVLPNGLEIKESLIRGEKSEGMICAEDELGLGKNHEGIMVLRDSAKIGESFAKYLKADDIILEIDNKSLSNRPDLLNHYGLARELAAIFSLALKPYEKMLDRKWKFLSDKENKLEVKVSALDACPRYMAVAVSNIEVKESPAWLKERLVAANQRPINNIVDLTNYVMFDCGQPMHAFDAAKIKKIVVRRADKGETIETLDEKERVLSSDDLVITDGHQAVAIAGVMGGHNSEINAETTGLVLESANFLAGSVRKTSQKLGLRTEASVRFEKALDPALTEQAMFRFLTLLKEICPKMEIVSALIDIDNTDKNKLTVDLDLDWLKNKIGQEIPREEVINILEKLGFTIEDQKSAVLKVAVPSWRATKDVSSKEDVAEEVLRLYGYNNIESRLPVFTMDLPEVNEERKIERKIKNILSLKNSLNEAYNYSFVGEDQLKKMNIDFFNYLKLANPLSGIQNLLRQSLAPGLASNIKANQFKSERFGFFEIGSAFFKNPGNIRKDETEGNFLPYQEKRLGLAVTGEEDNFGQLKSIIDSLFKNIFNQHTEAEFSIIDGTPGWADKYAIAKVLVFGQEIGIVGSLSQEVINNMNLKRGAALAELNFNKLVELVLGQPSFHFAEAPKYPPVMRDVAFVVENKILYNDLRREMSRFNPLIRSVELFDVYIGNKLEGGKKSLAFHLSYQSEDRTLTAGEVDKIQTDLVAHLAQKFEVRLRDF